jgi:hypothetical protein
MKNFNDYLEVIQELRQSGDSGNGDSEDMNDNPWNEVSMDDGVDDVFEYGDLLDDWKDPLFKNRWKNITIEIGDKKLEGKIIENYALTYNIFHETKTGKFYYQDPN